eukprot:scaffold6349_cov167-Amphora_coffeaeformis.AAC.2
MADDKPERIYPRYSWPPKPPSDQIGSCPPRGTTTGRFFSSILPESCFPLPVSWLGSGPYERRNDPRNEGAPLADPSQDPDTDAPVPRRMLLDFHERWVRSPLLLYCQSNKSLMGQVLLGVHKLFVVGGRSRKLCVFGVWSTVLWLDKILDEQSREPCKRVLLCTPVWFLHKRGAARQPANFLEDTLSKRAGKSNL